MCIHMLLKNKSIALPLLLSLLFHGLLISTLRAGKMNHPTANKQKGLHVTLAPTPAPTPYLQPKSLQAHQEQTAHYLTNSQSTNSEKEKNFTWNNDDSLLSNPDHYFEAWELDALPTAINKIKPNYPAHAQEIGVVGEVTLELLIDENGQIVSIKIIDTTVPLIFDRAALDAFRDQPFQPAEINSKPVKSRMVSKVKFDEGFDSAHPR